VTRRELVRVAAFFVVATCIFTWPLAGNLAGSIWPLGPDGNLFMWTLAWGADALASRPWAIFDANIFYPYGNTLAYSENLIGSALVTAPVLWLGGGPVLALNLVALFTCVMSGIGAYVLGRRLGLAWTGALVAGMIFAFDPPRFFRTGQLHLGAVQWIPFGLAALHAYLDGGRPGHLRWAALLFSLQALTSGHGAAFMALAYGLLLVYRLALGERLAPRQRLRDLGVAGALALVPAVLVYLPYRRVQQEMGLRRTLENWVVNPESFIASPSHLHQWIVSWFSPVSLLETASALLFPGYLPLLLAAVALMTGVLLAARPGPVTADTPRWRDRWRASPQIFYGLLTLTCVWLALGPPLGIWPLVYDWPGLSLVRVPSRFTILGMLGIAVLAGFGFEALARRMRIARVGVAAAVTCVWLAAEFAAFPMTAVPYTVDPPPAHRWLARLPEPVVVAEVPLPDPRHAGAFERRQTEFMLNTIAHWHRTIHGYSGFRPPLHEQLYDRLLRFPDDECLDALMAVGVTHVVVHADLYPPGEWESVRARILARDRRLKLKHVAGPGRVYELN
jgi:hypothetical protein